MPDVSSMQRCCLSVTTLHYKDAAEVATAAQAVVAVNFGATKKLPQQRSCWGQYWVDAGLYASILEPA